MSRYFSAVQHPIFYGFAVYGCVQVALFGIIGMLALVMPALWWALLSIPAGCMLVKWLGHHGQEQLSQLVGMCVSCFVGAVVGIHARELFCLATVLA